MIINGLTALERVGLTSALGCPAAPARVVPAPLTGQLSAADRAVCVRALQAHHTAHAGAVARDQLQGADGRSQQRRALTWDQTQPHSAIHTNSAKSHR